MRWLDSNHGPLESEATTFPTERQPLPFVIMGFYPANPILQHFVYLKRPTFFESYPIHYSPLNYHDLGFSRKLIHTNSLSLSLSWSMLQSNFFGGNRDFSKIKKSKNSFFALMSEPAQKYEEKCYFNRNKTLNFFIT